MKRNEWTFDYTAKVLAEAALKQVDVHATKLKWWEDKKVETMKKVSEGGIEVHDSVASTYSHTKGFAGPEITIDSGLQRDLNECQAKIRHHSELVNDYLGWHQVLIANPEARLSLEHDDYLYFFGK
jgi:hypothetical protein